MIDFVRRKEIEKQNIDKYLFMNNFASFFYTKQTHDNKKNRRFNSINKVEITVSEFIFLFLS